MTNKKINLETFLETVKESKKYYIKEMNGITTDYNSIVELESDVLDIKRNYLMTYYYDAETGTLSYKRGRKKIIGFRK